MSQPTFAQLNEPLLKAPMGVAVRDRAGRVSPLMDEWEGQEVREDVHEAWVLSADTRAQLQNRGKIAIATCPALMADIKLVSCYHVHMIVLYTLQDGVQGIQFIRLFIFPPHPTALPPPPQKKKLYNFIFLR